MGLDADGSWLRMRSSLARSASGDGSEDSEWFADEVLIDGTHAGDAGSLMATASSRPLLL